MRTPTRRHRLAATGGLIAFAVVLAGCLTPGTYSARNPANGFAPGLWRTAGALSTDPSAPPCYWKRLPAKGPDPGLVFPAQSTRGGPRYVQIDTGDGLVTSGCGNWWQQVPAGRFAKWLVAPGDPFPEGDFAVGPEVAPGTYQATGAGGTCYWARLSGFRGTAREVIETGDVKSPRVTIEPGDAGFSSSDCGIWAKIA